MSKSKGTFIAAETYLKHVDPTYLRYFYASKLTQRVEDLDLGIEEFSKKINTDLVGKVVNLQSGWKVRSSDWFGYPLPR